MTDAELQRIVASHRFGATDKPEVYSGKTCTVRITRTWFMCSCGHKERPDPDPKIEWDRYVQEVLQVKPQRDLFEEARIRHLMVVLEQEAKVKTEDCQ